MILAIVVVVLLVGADVGGRFLAQAGVAGRAQTRLGTPSPPEVQIGGVPFLTQVVAGRYRSVHVLADDARLEVQGRSIPLRRLDATFEDVVAGDAYRRLVAGRGEITAVLRYQDLAALTGLDLSSASDGRVQVSFELNLGGVAVSGVASGRPELDAEQQRLQFGEVEVNLTNGGDQTLAEAAGRLVLGQIPLAEMPYGLRLSAVEARADDVSISGTATNIPLQTP